MKKIIITCSLIAAMVPAFAQVVSGSTNSEQAKQTDADSVIYYRNKGSIAVNLSNFIIAPQGTVSMPVTIGFDATIVKNFTVGGVMTYLQMKNETQLSDFKTLINDHNTTYHQVLIGVKGNYHLMPLVQKFVKKPLLTNYVDVYATGWGGYNVVFSGSSNANVKFMTDNQKFRGGAGLGVRSMIMPKFGFFIEGTYSSYGYVTFGITARAH